MIPSAPTSLDPIIVAAVVAAVDRCITRKGASIRKPAALDLVTLGDFWMEAVALAGEDLALQVAADMPSGAMGLWSYGTVSASSLRQAIELLDGTYLPRMLPELRLRIVAVDRERVDLQLDSEGDPIRLALIEEIALASLFAHLKLLATPATVHGVGLRRAAPADPTPWRSFFGVTPRFGWRRSVLRIAASDLETELRTANPALRTMVQSAVATVVDDSMSGAVRRYVRTNLANKLDAAEIARALDVSMRTLQRRLQDENASVRDLVTDERIAAARKMLENSSEAISAIAIAVGFAQQESLTRAFINATGESPRAYRRRVVGEE